MNKINLTFRGSGAGGGVEPGARSRGAGLGWRAGSPQPSTFRPERCRRPCLVADRATLPQKWLPPSQNVAASCLVPAVVEQVSDDGGSRSVLLRPERALSHPCCDLLAGFGIQHQVPATATTRSPDLCHFQPCFFFVYKFTW